MKKGKPVPVAAGLLDQIREACDDSRTPPEWGQCATVEELQGALCRSRPTVARLLHAWQRAGRVRGQFSRRNGKRVIVYCLSDVLAMVKKERQVRT